jgi:hypothetical protein
MTNTAAAVSLILLGPQTIWAHSEYIGRASHASSPSIQPEVEIMVILISRCLSSS